MLIYKVFIKKVSEKSYISYAPAFDNYTQGDSLYNTIKMSRDMIGSLYISNNDENIDNPDSDFDINYNENFDYDYFTLIDIDVAEYRKIINNKSVKKNCSIPYWMELEADKLGINYSQLLQKSIEEEIKKLH